MIVESYACEIVTTYKKKRFKVASIKNREDFVDYVRKCFPKNAMNHYECFGAIFLDQAGNVKGHKIISIGGIASTAVDIRLLLQACISCNSVQLVIFHNHPAGGIIPSQADIDLTKKVRKVTKFHDLTLIDSLIITENNFSEIKFR